MTPLGRVLARAESQRETGSTRCEGEWIVYTLDRAPARTGLLIVSGGNEIATGPQRSMARLAARIAAAGWPVIRFDRRGIGDSGGANGGYTSATPDIVALQQCARRLGIERLVAFGNCDAAAALAELPPIPIDERLRDVRAPIVGRVLANPWLGERADDLPSPAAIRDRYRRRLADPRFWRTLLTGGVDVQKLRRGVHRALGRDQPPPAMLPATMAALRRWPLPTTIVLSRRDAAGITFRDAWHRHAGEALKGSVPIETIDTASHGFTHDADLDRLAAILMRALKAGDAAAA